MIATKDADDAHVGPLGWHDSKTKLATDEKFENYIEYMHISISNIVHALSKGMEVLDQRPRRLQHFLIDLIDILDPPEDAEADRSREKCNPAAHCDCLSLEGNGA